MSVCWFRHAVVLLIFFRSDEQTCSSVEREYQEKYASVVDSLDEQTGEVLLLFCFK